VFRHVRMYTERSQNRRDYVFPPLPEALPVGVIEAQCGRRGEQELAQRGMQAELDIRADGAVIFRCSLRPLAPAGGGEPAEDWGAIGFLVRLQASFEAAVNAELEAMGLPHSYLAM
jgi:hypothetical protein